MLTKGMELQGLAEGNYYREPHDLTNDETPPDSDQQPRNEEPIKNPQPE